MKVAHSLIIKPGASGLYETARELVAGLRKLGVDSRMVDPVAPRPFEEDRGALTADIEWAKGADVIASHSGLSAEMGKIKAPCIWMSHGRPRGSWLLEKKSTKVYSSMYRANRERSCKAVVTFWPEHEPYLQVMFPDTPVHVIQSCVDLEQWKPEEGSYNFGGAGGAINVVCADMWRDDVDPFIVLNAYALWARGEEDVKLHLYSVDDPGHPVALLKTIENYGNLGQVLGHVKGLERAYHAADISITSQNIDTRSVRESMACGCPVVRIADPKLNGFVADFNDALKADRAQVRAEAVRRFNPSVTARQFAGVLEDVL